MPEKNPQSEGQLVTVGPLAPGQRWSLARKREVALRLLRGELTMRSSRLASLAAHLTHVRWSCAHRCGEAVASRGDRSWEARDC